MKLFIPLLISTLVLLTCNSKHAVSDSLANDVKKETLRTWESYFG